MRWVRVMRLFYDYRGTVAKRLSDTVSRINMIFVFALPEDFQVIGKILREGSV